MILETLVVGAFGTNCYIFGCEETNEGAVIDPGGDGPQILAKVKSLGLNITTIINTHGHVDHIAANAEVKEATGADIVIHEADAGMLTNPASNLSLLTPVSVRNVPADRTVTAGDVIKVGTIELTVLHTPGHTPGGITLVTGDIAFSGDALFADSIGRSDFPGGSHEQLIDSIKTQILTLPESTRVFPGHGPETTVAREIAGNPFLR